MAAATSQLSMWQMILTLLVEYSSARKDQQAMRSQFAVSVRIENENCSMHIKDISYPNGNLVQLEAKKKNLVESGEATHWSA